MYKLNLNKQFLTNEVWATDITSFVDVKKLLVPPKVKKHVEGEPVEIKEPTLYERANKEGATLSILVLNRENKNLNIARNTLLVTDTSKKRLADFLDDNSIKHINMLLRVQGEIRLVSVNKIVDEVNGSCLFIYDLDENHYLIKKADLKKDYIAVLVNATSERLSGYFMHN